MKRIETINSKLPALDQEKELLEKSLKIGQKTVMKIGKNNEIIKQSLVHFSFIRDMYDNIDESELNKLNDLEFDELNKNIDLALCPKQTYNNYLNASQSHFADRNGFTSILTSTGTATIGIVTSQCVNFHKQNPNLFTNGSEILNEYSPKNEAIDNINYIRQELEKINSTILGDFEYLALKLNLFSVSKTQYQDIIGARSSFFFNFIFNRQETTRSNTRRDQIIQFVFGNTVYDSNADTVIDQTMDLYRELSSQDLENPSVKIGNVSTFYISSILTKLFAIIASLLKLRDSYHS